MRRAALALLLVSGAAVAAFGTLVSQRQVIIAGQTYTECTYDVQGQMVAQTLPGFAMCPPTINF